MKIGDKVKYIIDNKEHSGSIVWLSADDMNVFVKDSEGILNKLHKTQIILI